MIGKHQRERGAIGDNSLKVIALANRAEGVSACEVKRVLGVPRGSDTRGRIHGLLVRGYIRVDKSGGYGKTRYFAIPNPSHDWNALPVPEVPPKPEKPKREAVAKAKKAQKKRQRFDVVPEKPSRPAPVTIKAKPNRAPSGDRLVMASDAVVTKAAGWTHDIRYQVGPGEKVAGGFATLGIGRYIE